MTDDNERDRPTRQEILERFGWQPGEKEQLEREMAERQRLLQETRAAEASRQRETGQQRPAADTATIRERRDAATYWKGHIRTEINKSSRRMCEMIAKETAKAIVDEERARKRGDDTEERDRIQHYNDICRRFHDYSRIEEVARLRVQIAALQERIAAMEAAAQPSGRPLKAVG